MGNMGEREGMNSAFWQKRNVLVTGATGLLGSWVTKFLVESGVNVVAIIRDHVPKSHLFLNSSFPQINVVEGNIEDYFVIERTLGEYEIDTILHLAAQTIAPIANRNPLSTFETNIRGTWTVLEACRRSPLVKYVLVASSDKAYGDAKDLPYTEETPLRGEHPYDVSKSCADLIARAYFVSYGLPICITRCGNLFGGGDLNFNRLVPGVIRSVIFNESPVLRSNGKFIRDFIYVEDAAKGILKVVETMEKKKIMGEAFNISMQSPLTVIAMVKKILEHMDSKLLIQITEDSSNEIVKQYLSARKARAILGWKPEFSLDQGIEKTVSWYKNFFENVKK